MKMANGTDKGAFMENTKIEYAKDNILQSLENVISYASYINTDDNLRYEIEELAERFKKRIEKKFREYEKATSC